MLTSPVYRHDFSDEKGAEYGRWDGAAPPSTVNGDGADTPTPPSTLMPPQNRVFGRPFVTAGWIVVLVTALVASLQLVILAFVLDLSHKT